MTLQNCVSIDQLQAMLSEGLKLPCTPSDLHALEKVVGEVATWNENAL